MKIAVMMRTIDQDNSFGVFTGNLLRPLLTMDRTNSYLLLYKEPNILAASRICQRKGIAAAVEAQIVLGRIHGASGSMARACGHCPVTMGLHEAAWWAIPEHHTWWDNAYMRTMLPFYCWKSSHFFPWTQFMLGKSGTNLDKKAPVIRETN